MRIVIRLVICALFLLTAPASNAYSLRGLGRIQGTVAEDTSGTPLGDVNITATKEGAGGSISASSDTRGLWAVGGMSKGVWHLVFQKPGYVPTGAKVTMPVELARVPPIAVTLKKGR